MDGKPPTGDRKPRSSDGTRKPRESRAGGSGGSKQPRSAGPKGDRPGPTSGRRKPVGDRPTGRGDRERPTGERSRPSFDRPRGDAPRGDRAANDRGANDRGARPAADRPRSGGGSDRPRSTSAGYADREVDRPRVERPRDPLIPEDVAPEELDKGVLLELRTLPEGLAEIVARHLVAADRCMVNGDIASARAHIEAARRRAGRVSAIREAAAIAAYTDGDFSVALAELRAVRRMSGGIIYAPMIADCERGLGRPQKALDYIRAINAPSMDTDTRIELLLVAAGARADLGQVEAAVVTLQVPELTRLPPGTTRARLQYAYSDLLSRAGRSSEAWEWMERAAGSDLDGATDAAERCEELAGISFIEEVGDLPEVDPSND